VIAVVALMALYFGGGIPLDQPAGATSEDSRQDADAVRPPPATDIS
jgi:hypothetical protein